MSTTYPSDLSDAAWTCVQRYLPPVSTRGRPRIHPLRRILDVIFYVLCTGCARVSGRELPPSVPFLWRVGPGEEGSRRAAGSPRSSSTAAGAQRNADAARLTDLPRRGESATDTTSSSRAAALFWTGLGHSGVGWQLDRIRLSEVGRAAHRGPVRGFGELSLR